MADAAAMLDLQNAGRDELLRVVLARREAIAALERPTARLAAYPDGSGASGNRPARDPEEA